MSKTPHAALRLLLESAGVAVLVIVHFAVALVYVLGSSLRGMPAGVYWSIVGAGYVAMPIVGWFGRGGLRALKPRSRFDAWLIAFPIAILATLLLMLLRLPLRFGGWDAHGMGASGAEANAVFLPWLHLVVWVLAARIWSARFSGGMRRPDG